MDRSRFRRFLSLGVGVTTLADIVPPAAGPRQRDPELELHVRGLLGRYPMHAGKPFLIIGRSRRCDIRLPGNDVNPQHAYVQLFRGGAYCIDLGSQSGTIWSFRRRRADWMQPGEPVGIGPFSIICRAPEICAEAEFGCDAESLLSDKDFPMFGARPAELVPLNARAGDEPPQPWQIRQPVTLIGRHARCGPRLKHPSVARFHSSLIATPSALWLADLRSGRSTRVNDCRIRFRRLRQDDVVGIGDFRLKIRYPDLANVKLDGSATVAGRRDATRPYDDAPSVLHQQLSAMSREQTLLAAQLLDAAPRNGKAIVDSELDQVRKIDGQIVQLMSTIEPSSNDADQRSELVDRLFALNRERSRRIEKIMEHIAKGDR